MLLIDLIKIFHSLGGLNVFLLSQVFKHTLSLFYFYKEGFDFMQTNEDKIAIKKAISLDMDFAMEWIDKWLNHSLEPYNELLLHQSTYRNIKNDLRKSLIDDHKANQRIGALRYQLLEWVDQIDEDDLNPNFKATSYIEQLRQKEKETPSSTTKSILSKGTIAAIVMSFLVGFLWFVFSKDDTKNQTNSEVNTFDLDVFVYGDSAKSKVITEGDLRFVYDGKPEKLAVGKNGRIVLSNISTSLRQQKISINPQIENYHTEQIELSIPAKGNGLEVILQAIQHQTNLRGNIANLNGNPLVGVTVNIEGIETTTDQRGDFNQLVPFKKGKEVRIRVFKEEKAIFNGMERISDQLIELTID